MKCYFCDRRALYTVEHEDVLTPMCEYCYRAHESARKGYEEGYRDGYDDGVEKGYEGGYKDGYDDGYQQALAMAERVLEEKGRER